MLEHAGSGNSRDLKQFCGGGDVGLGRSVGAPYYGRLRGMDAGLGAES
ncbi:hypothetical protein AHiyo4_16410 [Arthrobacter sp. Hiyo4]|nr:hypothetical protein AHiyo4_16410 [Arthrobacter sp. Hiyo4]